MKISAVLTLLFLVGMMGYAQPVITKTDMPAVGDTIRYRSTVIPTGLNYQNAGANLTWDFSSLTGNSMGADTFVSPNSTSIVYQVAFNLPFDPNKATLASPQSNINLIPNVPLTNIINYYRNSNTAFNNMGFGATVAGVPLPIKYTSPDVWYHFPITYGSQDSSFAPFAAGIPNVGYFATSKKRVNEVDAWGTLILPTGTFQTIRVKSTVIEQDSIYIDSLNMGVPITRNIVEYKWLASGQGLPVCQVTVESGFLTTFRWLDQNAVGNPLAVMLPADQTICEGESLDITASASGGTAPYTYVWSSLQTGQTISVSPASTTTYTVTVFDAGFNMVSASVTITVVVCTGLTEPVQNLDIEVFPNPVVNNRIYLKSNSENNTRVELFNSLGVRMLEKNISFGSSGEAIIDLNLYHPTPGFYFLKYLSSDHIITKPLIIQ